MLAEEWEQIKVVFETALALREDQRSEYLARACAGYDERLAIVKELLNDHVRAGKFLESISIKIHGVFTEGDLVASRFRILRFINHGGMGEVYEAYDERLRLRLALKTLRPTLKSDPHALKRFEREILVAREVSHEGLCKIFDLVEHVATTNPRTVIPCLSMQLIEGESLLSYLESHRPLHPDVAMPIIRQIAGAVDALHDHGILHRDLKPSNIMLTNGRGSMRAIVTDFGLAKAINAAGADFFESQLSFQFGAPYFMAPELLRGSRPSIPSDIYALGLIIDEMMTQSRAFQAESLHALYYQKLWERPLSPSARSTDLAPHWAAVILRCLSEDPKDRYQRASDLITDLTRSITFPSDTVPRNPEPVQRPHDRHRQFSSIPRKFRTVLAVLAILLLGVWGGTASFLHGRAISVLVFPIENLTGQREYDYLCKGTTAEVMRRLTVTGRVQVIPYYELRSKTPPGTLKGRYSLDGILQIAGSQARLTAELFDNKDGSLIWSQNIDQSMRNSLQLQSEMAEGAIRALDNRALFGLGNEATGSHSLSASIVRLLGLQRVALPPPATGNPAAFDYYIRGRALLDERTVPAALDAFKSFQNALREDPGFSLAKAGMADLQPILMDYDYEPTAVLAARALDYATEAVRLSPDIADVYTSLGAARQNIWDFGGAEEAYRKAIRINPRFSKGHRWYAGLVLQFGRFDEGISEARKAVELDPYDFSGLSTFGWYLYLARQYVEASKTVEEALARSESIYARNYLGDIYFQLAQQSSGEEARSYFARAIEQADRVEAAMRRTMLQAPPASAPQTIKFADRMHAEYYAVGGRPDSAAPYLARLKADTAAGRTSPVPLAMYYAVIGDVMDALPLLERAAGHKDRQLLYLKVSPQFDKIRRHPRFQALISGTKL